MRMFLQEEEEVVSESVGTEQAITNMVPDNSNILIECSIDSLPSEVSRPNPNSVILSI